MRLSSLVLAFLALTSVFVMAQDEKQPIVTMSIPKHPDPPFATQLRKMVIVVETTCNVGGVGKQFLGTGFIVGYHDPKAPKDSSFLLLGHESPRCGMLGREQQ